MKEEKININGRRLNKLEEVVKLLQKLNEVLYTDEYREQNGYPCEMLLKADGSGEINDNPYNSIYRFKDTKDLEDFLTATQHRRLALVRNQKENN